MATFIASILSNVEAQRTTSMEQEIILNLNNVSKVYHDNNNNSNKESQDFLERTVLEKANLDIRERECITILFVTHNINGAVALGDRVIVMSPLLANTRREFRIDLPGPRQLAHPLINSITKELIEESKDLFFYSFLQSHSESIDNSHASGSEYEITSAVLCN
jgi:ABC-type sugar transport system ATPase subunit